MEDLDSLHYFLGIEVSYFTGGLFLSQSKYASDILLKTGMLLSEPIGTPLAYKHNLRSYSGPLIETTFYRSIVGALQ